MAILSWNYVGPTHCLIENGWYTWFVALWTLDQHRINRWQLRYTDQKKSNLSVFNQKYCQYSANVGPTNNCYLGHIFWCLVWPPTKDSSLSYNRFKRYWWPDIETCHALWLLTFWLQNHPANPVNYFKLHEHAFFEIFTDPEILLYTKKPTNQYISFKYFLL